MSDDATVLSLPGRIPAIDPTAFLAAGARVIGSVTIGEGSSVWYNAVLRADSAEIRIGAGSNAQDSVSVHVDPGHGVTIGDDVSIGHNAIVHGCTIGDGSLIGMGAVVLNGAVIGSECLVAGGALVLSGMEVPDGSLVAGVPAKVRRELTAELQRIRERGWSFVNSELVNGLFGVAIALPCSTCPSTIGLNVTSIGEAWSDEEIEQRIVPALQACAEALRPITESLG